MIKLGEFLPDQPDYKNGGATVANNVIPAINGYRSFNNVLPLSGAADDYIRGMFAAKDDSGAAAIYVGDETKLYRFDATDSSLDNISKSGNYSSGVNDKWRFVQFGESVIAQILPTQFKQLLRQHLVSSQTFQQMRRKQSILLLCVTLL
jgi:hypothetical protein